MQRFAWLVLGSVAWLCMGACTQTHPPVESGGAAGGRPVGDGGAHVLDAGDIDGAAGDGAVVDGAAGDGAVVEGGDAAMASDRGEAGDDAVVDYEKLIELCAASPTGFDRTEQDAQLIDKLVGKWLDCRNSTGFHPQQDGVWFRRDQTWAALFFARNARVRVGTGADETGEWSVYREPDPGPQPPLLSVDQSNIVRPVFTREPIQLREADENAYLNRYVRLRDVLKEGPVELEVDACEDPIELPLLDQAAPLAPLEESGEGSGIVECKDGAVARTRAVRCPDIMQAYDPTGPYRGGRLVDLPNGGVALESECASDDDCQAGYVCQCATRLAPWTACVPGNCASEADCGGKECGAEESSCGEISGFFCRTDADECRSGARCPPDWFEDAERLEYSSYCVHGDRGAEGGAWMCRFWDGDCE